MKISKKIKALSAIGLLSVSLVGCSNTQMAATGLALAGTMAAIGAYNWVNNPDAETALDESPTKVFQSVRDTIGNNESYHITSTTVGEKQSQIVAQINQQEVKIVVENIGNNESKIYIKDGRGKDQAQILLQKIIKDIK